MRSLLVILLQLDGGSAPAAARNESSRKSEYTALLSVKEAFTAASQVHLDSWNTSTDLCNWTGITCNLHQHVVSLHLSNFNLTGRIPPIISRLSHLMYLNLSYNSFSSVFNKRLLRLSRLEVLDFHGNKLSGNLPAEISRLRHLRHLNLGDNNFNRVIPREIGNLKKLETMDLSSNNFSGEVPTQITGLEYLKYLNLSRNNLNGSIPSSLAKMPSLKSLDISYNSFSGLIPSQFASFNRSSFHGNPDIFLPYMGSFATLTTWIVRLYLGLCVFLIVLLLVKLVSGLKKAIFLVVGIFKLTARQLKRE